jgi:hypothetical protein
VHLRPDGANVTVGVASDPGRGRTWVRWCAYVSFVAFVAGSFAFVLTLVSLVDEDALLRLELSPGRSVLWYLGVFTAIFAIARPFVPSGTHTLAQCACVGVYVCVCVGVGV